MLNCEECGCTPTLTAHGWVAQHARDPDDASAELEIAFYCPLCAEREFEVTPRASYT